MAGEGETDGGTSERGCACSFPRPSSTMVMPPATFGCSHIAANYRAVFVRERGGMQSPYTFPYLPAQYL